MNEKTESDMCSVCDEFKPWGFARACPCCSSEAEPETVECEYCDGLGFFPFYDRDFIKAKEYRKLSEQEKRKVDASNICIECGGTGEIEK